MTDTPIIPLPIPTPPKKKPVKKKPAKKKPAKKKPVKKKHIVRKSDIRRGPIKKNWPTLAEASVLVKARGIKSRSEYRKWHETTNPVFVPRFPVRVYTDWTTWNEFLGTNHSFRGHKRPNMKMYWDAVRYVQSLNIGTRREYREIYDEGILIDVPKYPEAHYEEWTQWSDYLGTSLSGKMKTIESRQALWVLVHIPGDAPNVVWFLKIGGEDILQDQIKPGWRVLAKYVYEEELIGQVWEVVEKTSAAQFDKEQRLCSNVNELKWELGNILLIAK